MASNLIAIASNLRAVVSNLRAIASNPKGLILSVSALVLTDAGAQTLPLVGFAPSPASWSGGMAVSSLKLEQIQLKALQLKALQFTGRGNVCATFNPTHYNAHSRKYPQINEGFAIVLPPVSLRYLSASPHRWRE